MPDRPGVVRRQGELVAHHEPRPAPAVAARVAALHHEVRLDAVEGEVVEELLVGQRGEAEARQRALEAVSSAICSVPRTVTTSSQRGVPAQLDHLAVERGVPRRSSPPAAAAARRARGERLPRRPRHDRVRRAATELLERRARRRRTGSSLPPARPTSATAASGTAAPRSRASSRSSSCSARRRLAPGEGLHRGRPHRPGPRPPGAGRSPAVTAGLASVAERLERREPDLGHAGRRARR